VNERHTSEKDDPRLVLWCRLGLLVVSLLHWLAIGMYLSQNAHAVTESVGLFSNLC
jgi:hypothetical protein